MSRRIGIIRASPELLIEALNLVHGLRVIRGLPEDDFDASSGSVRFLIEGPTLDEVPEGCEPPYYTDQFNAGLGRS
jgi:hypothetical protein